MGAETVAQRNELERDRAQFQAEKDQFEQMRRRINSIFEKQTVNGQSSDILKLNIGGVHYATTIKTLRSCPNTLLDCLTSDGVDVKLDDQGHVFIDRNGKLFAYILDFLRTGNIAWPTDVAKRNMLLAEIQFYGLGDKMVPSYTITLSSKYNSTANTVESLHNTNLATGCGTMNNTTDGEYILCTFPFQCSFRGVKIGPLVGWGGGCLNTAKLEYSTNGEHYETATCLNGFDEAIIEVPFEKVVNATHWRLSKSGWLGVGCLEFLFSK